MTPEQAQIIDKTDKFGNFLLTKAVRPVDFIPVEGFRRNKGLYGGHKLTASISKEKLLGVFFETLDLLKAKCVTVNLLYSDSETDPDFDECEREHIDLPVCKSILYDFEDLLANDGFVEIMVSNNQTAVCLRRTKILVIWRAAGKSLKKFETLLSNSGIYLNQKIEFMQNQEHFLYSENWHQKQFQELKLRLGIEEYET